jgi:K+-sensing histidine kinase KdpD
MIFLDKFIKYGAKHSIVELKQWIQKKSDTIFISVVGQSVEFSNDEDIFALGVRGRAATEKTAAGSGLGLHICRLIVDRLFQGTISASYIRARSVAKFEIRIPKAFTNKGGQ